MTVIPKIIRKKNQIETYLSKENFSKNHAIEKLNILVTNEDYKRVKIFFTAAKILIMTKIPFRSFIIMIDGIFHNKNPQSSYEEPKENLFLSSVIVIDNEKI